MSPMIANNEKEKVHEEVKAYSILQKLQCKVKVSIFSIKNNIFKRIQILKKNNQIISQNLICIVIV